jgi:hypothetical protein
MELIMNINMRIRKKYNSFYKKRDIRLYMHIVTLPITKMKVYSSYFPRELKAHYTSEMNKYLLL